MIRKDAAATVLAAGLAVFNERRTLIAPSFAENNARPPLIAGPLPKTTSVCLSKPGTLSVSTRVASRSSRCF